MGSTISNRREPKSCLDRVFNSKLGRIAILRNKCMAWHAATSKVENSDQGLSCQLKFVHYKSHYWKGKQKMYSLNVQLYGGVLALELKIIEAKLATFWTFRGQHWKGKQLNVISRGKSEKIFFGSAGLNHLVETKRVWKDCTLSAGGGGGRGIGASRTWNFLKGLPSK